METDWQFNLIKIKDRGQYILNSEKLADCRFVVGTPPNQRLIHGHRLLLAMASPVFEVMFYGSLPENDNFIVVPDIRPDTFKAMLDYIYTDEISILSFDNACELYYAAKKYMLPHVVEQCIKFLLADLSPKNACRTYEFAIFYEEPRLMESSMEHIVFNTREVIADPSFMDIKVSTLMAILDQNRLNIDTELDLFNCLLKFKNERGVLNDKDKDNKTVGNEIKLEPEDSSSEAASTMGEDKLRQAVKKIRFLTMTPEQFAVGPSLSKLLKKNEARAIFVKLLNPTFNEFPMPEGFCQSSKRDRADDHIKRYCISVATKFDIPNAQYTHSYISRLTFTVNTSFYLLGVQIKLPDAHLKYGDAHIKGFSACVQNVECLKIAWSSSIKNENDPLLELTFNRPVFIYRNTTYTIRIINELHQSLIMSSWNREMVCNGIKFNIYGANSQEFVLKSTVSGMIFHAT